MKHARSCFQVVTTFTVLVFLFVGNANAQTAVIRKDHLNKTRNLISKIPAQHQKLLSSGMQRILQLAQVLNDDRSKMAGNRGMITMSPGVCRKSCSGIKICKTSLPFLAWTNFHPTTS